MTNSNRLTPFSLLTFLSFSETCLTIFVVSFSDRCISSALSSWGLTSFRLSLSNRDLVTFLRCFTSMERGPTLESVSPHSALKSIGNRHKVHTRSLSTVDVGSLTNLFPFQRPCIIDCFPFVIFWSSRRTPSHERDQSCDKIVDIKSFGIVLHSPGHCCTHFRILKQDL
jgi:hypothetical protein